METQIAVLTGVILFITQIITRNWPKLNAMNVTLIVTLVVGTVSFFVNESITYLTVMIALATEVLGYDVFTKTIVPATNQAIKWIGKTPNFGRR